MKKFFSVILIIFMIIFYKNSVCGMDDFFIVDVKSGVITIDGINYKKSYREKNALEVVSVEKYKYSEDIIIPEEINGSKVVSIGRKAFYRCKSLVGIELSNNIKYIEDEAFSGCEKLEYIDLTKGVKMIGRMAFTACVNLKRADVSDELEYTGTSAFAYCKKLTYFHISKKLILINRRTFAETGIKSIEIPENIIDIAYDAFLGSDKIKTVELKNKFRTPSMSVIEYIKEIKKRIPKVNIIVHDANLIKVFALNKKDIQLILD